MRSLVLEDGHGEEEGCVATTPKEVRHRPGDDQSGEIDPCRTQEQTLGIPDQPGAQEKRLERLFVGSRQIAEIRPRWVADQPVGPYAWGFQDQVAGKEILWWEAEAVAFREAGAEVSQELGRLLAQVQPGEQLLRNPLATVEHLVAKGERKGADAGGRIADRGP